MNKQGKAKADKLRAEHARYSNSAAYFDKVAALKAEGPAGRAELKRMRDVRYDTDKRSGPGQMWNPKGKASARGSDAKARKINTGHNARQRQGL